MCELSPVSFHGDTIFCIDYQNQPFTPMRPIVENLGIDWSGQAAKFRANKTRWGVEMISTPTESGKQEMLCLPVRKLPAYLASINPNKVREELRPKIELYQAESDDALWNYWMNGKAERKASQADAPITPPMQAIIQTLVKAKVEQLPDNKSRKGYYPQVYGRFNNHFGIPRYTELPQSRMAEAVQYLVNLEIRPAKKIAPAPEQKKLDAELEEPVTLDRETYKHVNRLFDQLADLKMRVESLREIIHIMARPGKRMVNISPEKQFLYDNMDDAVNGAVTGMNIAFYNLRSACRIGSRTDFCKW